MSRSRTTCSRRFPGQTVIGDRRDAVRRRRPLRAGRRRLRHLERQSRPALRSRAFGDLRVAADGRLRGSRRVRIVADLSRLRCRLVPDGRRAGLGAVSRRLLDRSRRLGPDVGRSARRGAMRRSTTAAGRTSAAAGAGARARTSRVRSGRRRSSPGTAARAGGSPSVDGAPVYGWVPLGWREAVSPRWRQCSYNCWARYNRPYAVNVAVRPSAPPARYANLAVPGALSAVTALDARRTTGR